MTTPTTTDPRAATLPEILAGTVDYLPDDAPPDVVRYVNGATERTGPRRHVARFAVDDPRACPASLRPRVPKADYLALSERDRVAVLVHGLRLEALARLAARAEEEGPKKGAQLSAPAVAPAHPVARRARRTRARHAETIATAPAPVSGNRPSDAPDDVEAAPVVEPAPAPRVPVLAVVSCATGCGARLRAMPGRAVVAYCQSCRAERDRAEAARVAALRYRREMREEEERARRARL